jgi:hypothetical protein
MNRDRTGGGPSRKTSARSASWVSSIGIAGAGLISIVRSISADGLYEGAIGYLYGFLAVLGIFVFLVLSNRIRIRKVRAMNTSAFVANISIFLDLEPQMQEVRSLLSLPQSSKRKAGVSYANLAVDEGTVKIFRGYFRPKELFSAPSEGLSRSSIARVPQGTFNLNCIELEFTSETRSALLDLTLVRPTFGIGIQTKKSLGKSLDNILTAAGKTELDVR